MKRARREERRRESGGRGRTQRNGERKKKRKTGKIWYMSLSFMEYIQATRPLLHAK